MNQTTINQTTINQAASKSENPVMSRLAIMRFKQKLQYKPEELERIGKQIEQYSDHKDISFKDFILKSWNLNKVKKMSTLEIIETLGSMHEFSSGLLEFKGIGFGNEFGNNLETCNLRSSSQQPVNPGAGNFFLEFLVFFLEVFPFPEETLNTCRKLFLRHTKGLCGICQKRIYLLHEEGIYRLSAIGEIVVEKMQPLIGTLSVFEKNEKFWADRKLTPIPPHLVNRINELGNYRLIEPDLSHTFDLNPEFVKNLSNSTYIHMMTIKERGFKTALAISGFIFPFAFFTGFIVNNLLKLLGVNL